MPAQLIYDVGVHVGADTAFYLAQGCRVVGIEADPLLAQAARERFAAEIAEGRLTLLNIGIGEREGRAQFWVSERPLWSSFDRAMASRDGLACHPVEVPTRTLRQVFDAHGTPHYCKIDVEGYDRVCVESLPGGPVPKYLSVELDVGRAASDVELLASLGYDAFKVISQVTRAQPSTARMAISLGLPYRAGLLLRAAERRLRGVTRMGDFHFGEETSGPFAEATPGRWMNRAAVLALVARLAALEAPREARGLHEWFDLHARRAD